MEISFRLLDFNIKNEEYSTASTVIQDVRIIRNLLYRCLE